MITQFISFVIAQVCEPHLYPHKNSRSNQMSFTLRAPYTPFIEAPTIVSWCPMVVIQSANMGDHWSVFLRATAHPCISLSIYREGGWMSTPGLSNEYLWSLQMSKVHVAKPIAVSEGVRWEFCSLIPLGIKTITSPSKALFELIDKSVGAKKITSRILWSSLSST